MDTQCNGKSDESLNDLWYKRYNEKVATYVVHIQPQVLPPTEAAKKIHSFRVFYQICQWMGCSNEMQPVAWDWKMSKSGLALIQTDLLLAPENILHAIRCGCTSDYKKNGLRLVLIVKVWHAKMYCGLNNLKRFGMQKCKCLRCLRWWRI